MTPPDKIPTSVDADCDLPCARGIQAYDELFELHNGRHSTVWSARVAAERSKVVVIKGYSKLRLKPRQLRNVVRELHLLRLFRKTRCKGVVQLLSSFEESDIVYLIFEACMHGDLYQLLLRHKGALTEDFILAQVVFPLLTTLAHLHKLKIVHRDIKPENIFINNDGEVLLGDFGLAVHTQHDNLTERVGTLDYMAPEVLSMPTPDELSRWSRSKPPEPYTEKVDIWAVGILVYEMLAGAPPFEVEDPKETARLIMKSPVQSFPPGISAECKDFISQALQKDPSKRPGAHELLQHPWIMDQLDERMLRPTCPELAEKALKRIIHASWNAITLAALFDPAPLPQAAALQPEYILKKGTLHGASLEEIADMDAQRSATSFASKARSLSSGEDLVFDSDEDGEEDSRCRPPPRVSVPGHDVLISQDPMTREQLRVSGQFAVGGFVVCASVKEEKEKRLDKQQKHSLQKAVLPPATKRSSIPSQPGAAAQISASSMNHADNSAGCLLTGQEAKQLESSAEHPSSFATGCASLTQVTIEHVVGSDCFQGHSKDSSDHGDGPCSWSDDANAMGQRIDPFSAPGSVPLPRPSSADPSTSMDGLIKRCISSPASHEMSKAAARMVADSQPHRYQTLGRGLTGASLPEMMQRQNGSCEKSVAVATVSNAALRFTVGLEAMSEVSEGVISNDLSNGKSSSLQVEHKRHGIAAQRQHCDQALASACKAELGSSRLAASLPSCEYWSVASKAPCTTEGASGSRMQADGQIPSVRSGGLPAAETSQLALSTAHGFVPTAKNRACIPVAAPKLGMASSYGHLPKAHSQEDGLSNSTAADSLPTEQAWQKPSIMAVRKTAPRSRFG